MSVSGSLLTDPSPLFTGRVNLRGTLFPDGSAAQSVGASTGFFTGISVGLAVGIAQETEIEEAGSAGELVGFLSGIGSAAPQIKAALEQGKEIGDGIGTKRGFVIGLNSVEAQTFSTRFTMRALYTVTSNFVYWDVLDTPDTDGSRSPFSPSDLLNILIVARVDGASNA